MKVCATYSFAGKVVNITIILLKPNYVIKKSQYFLIDYEIERFNINFVQHNTKNETRNS